MNPLAALLREIMAAATGAIAILCLLQVLPAGAGGWQLPDVGDSVSAMLLDADSGAVLWSQAPGRSIPPASLTKLMTLHLALESLESGAFTLQDLVEVRADEAAAAFHPAASVMGLEPGKTVAVRDLLLGAAVASGNDAARALARIVSGSEAAFVDRMNRRAHELGLDQSHFVDPVGLSPDNTTTARDMAALALAYIRDHGDMVEELHGQPSIRRLDTGTILANRNPLIGLYPGCLGLKTGHISRSGYNIVLFAVRGRTRLVGVILGLESDTAEQGRRALLQAGTALLDHGFSLAPPASGSH